MTWRLRKLKDKGKLVFTNHRTNFTDGYVDGEMLSEMPNDIMDAALGIDEIHQILDARRTGKTIGIKITYLVLQIRKRHTELDYTTQDFSQVDKRLRKHTKILIECTNMGCGERDCENQSCGILSCGYYMYRMFRVIKQTGEKGKYLGKFVLKGSRDFYTLYDTDEIIKDMTI